MYKNYKANFKKISHKLNLKVSELYILIVIILTSFFLRFVNYSNRWGLAYDQARDTIVSHQILIEKSIPVSGPFSASGPFVFGPIWYWFHSFITLLNPNEVMWLWYVQTSISAIMPIVLFFAGKKLINAKFGLLLALLFAISTAQIAQATNLTYSTFAGFVSVFMLLFLVYSIKTKRSLYVFLTAFCMGLAINIHFQAVGFFLMLPILIVFNAKNLKNIALIIVGFLIPFLPLLIFDFTSNHYQSSNILEYLFNRGSNAALPKRWLTYIGEFWPNAYSHIIGGYWPMGIILPVIIFVTTLVLLIKKKIEAAVFLVLLFFSLNFVVLRYFKGNIYDAFLVFLHPSIILITAWVIYKIIRWKLVFGLLILIVTVAFTLVKNYEEISNATNFTAVNSINTMNHLTKKFPEEKFAMYDYEFKNSSRSYPTVMYMMKNNLLSDSGRKIGFVRATISAELEIHESPVVMGKLNENILLDLSSFSKEDLLEKGWIFINPSGVYDSVINWYKE